MTAARPVLVLLRPRPQAPKPPEATAIGRAALALRAEGVKVCVGSAQAAWWATPGAWVRASTAEVGAVHDRYPSWTWPEGYAEALRGLERLPRGNPHALQALCRDKLASQRALEAAGLRMPEIEDDPSRFAERLEGWGAGFLKPRGGALGRGVRRVVPGDPLPSEGEGAVRGQTDALILQRAVPPPEGVAALCLRALVSREVDGSWVVAPPVARRSLTDPVANVDRGAEALPAEDLLPADTLAAARALCVRVAEALRPGHEPLVELGVDLVIGADMQPQLIEVNSRPGGRLEVLYAQDPARFAEAHLQACARPLRALARADFAAPSHLR